MLVLFVRSCVPLLFFFCRSHTRPPLYLVLGHLQVGDLQVHHQVGKLQCHQQILVLVVVAGKPANFFFCFRKMSPAMKVAATTLPSHIELMIQVLADSSIWCRANIWATLSDVVWQAHSAEYSNMRTSAEVTKYYKGPSSWNYMLAEPTEGIHGIWMADAIEVIH